MTALSFPISPEIGDIYQAPNNTVYIYDGQKWNVQGTTITSADTTNFVQDTIAPIFTNIVGDGISFSYNDETNVLSASVTGAGGGGLSNAYMMDSKSYIIRQYDRNDEDEIYWVAVDGDITSDLGSDYRYVILHNDTPGLLRGLDGTPGYEYDPGPNRTKIYVLGLSSNIYTGSLLSLVKRVDNPSVLMSDTGVDLDYQNGRLVISSSGKMVAKNSFDREFGAPPNTSFLNNGGQGQIDITFGPNTGLYFRILLRRLSDKFDSVSTFHNNYQNIRAIINPSTDNLLVNVTSVTQVSSNPAIFVIYVDAVPASTTAVDTIQFLYDFYNTAGFDVTDGSYGMATDDDDIEIRSGRDIDLFAGDDVRIGAGSIFEMELRQEDDQDPTNGIVIKTANDSGFNEWKFQFDGSLQLPTLSVDLHNGGVQTGRVLRFADPSQQAIITGPAPANPGDNAQRLIIQGQNGGEGEGGDVYVWAGDADVDGGDIKIYAGDADSPAQGYGGYVNIAGGNGYNEGGHVHIDGGYSANGTGGDVRLQAGGSSNNLPGKVELRANNAGWLFKPNGDLQLPAAGDIVDSNGDSVLGNASELIGDGSAAGIGFTRTVYTDYFDRQGGEADGNANGDWFYTTDVTGVETGDTITFQQGEVRTISNVTVNGLYTDIEWSGGAVTGSDTSPRYPVTITSSDYSAPIKATARVKPDSTAAGNYSQYMDIYAGGASPVIDSKHIHMSGHTGEIELFLGSDNNYVAAKEEGTAPAGVRLHSENDVTVESSNLRINRKGSTWSAVYGDGQNVNSVSNTNDLTFGPIAVDEHGDYYVGGEHCYNADAIISKYGRDGNLIWSNYNEGDTVVGWDVKAIAYHNGEVASAVSTNVGRSTQYLKLVVQDSTTGEVKSTTDIYDTNNTVNARSMIYHSTLGWVLAGRTFGEVLSTSTITATGNTGVGIIELPSTGTKLDNIFPAINGDWYITGTNIPSNQYLNNGLGMYRNIPITSVTGAGSSAVARISVSYNDGTYTDFNVTTQGSGYALNDELKIPGSLLGGVDGGSTVTATVSNVGPGDNITAQFAKADYPDLYDQLKWASYTVSYNASTHDVLNIVESNDGLYWDVTIQGSDTNITVATFYTANGNDVTFTAQVSGDALVGPNSSLSGVASRKIIRLDMGFALGYGSVNFTGGTFTLLRQLNSQPWVWTSGWTRYLNPADTYGSGTAYTVVEVPAGGLLVGGYMSGVPINYSFIWKLNANGSTNWVKKIGSDSSGVLNLAVSTVDGSIYATTTYNNGTINKLDYTGTLLIRKEAIGMWGIDPHVKLEIDLDGQEYVYIGGAGGGIFTPNNNLMVNKFTSGLQPIWGRSMGYNGVEGMNINYADTYNNFVLGKGQATLVGYSSMFGNNNTNAVMFTMDTTDEFTPVDYSNWIIRTHADMRWETQTDWSTGDILSDGVEAKVSSAEFASGSGLALSNWRFQERVINLNQTTNGIVGVESIIFADGNVLDHNPSDIPPSVGFNSQDSWNYTLQLSDRGRFIINQIIPNTSYAQNLTITVPRNDVVQFPVGTVITLINSNSSSGNGYKIFVDPQSYGDPNAPQIWATGGNQNPSTWSFQGIQTATLMKISTNGWLLTANDIINED